MMRHGSLPPRRTGPLPIIPEPETDEILSSWLTRVAAVYNAKLSSLLEQIGCQETSPSLLDRRTESSDTDIIALSLRRDRSEIIDMTFSGVAPEALDFVTHGAPGLRCYTCCAELAARGLHGVVMRRWHVTVATNCRRCGSFLRPSRHRVGAIISDAIRDEEFRAIHENVCSAIEGAADDGPTMAAVRRGMRALAAPIPIKGKARTVARRKGKLPHSVERPPPLLWQMIDMTRFQKIAGNYKGWAPPSNRPFASWPPVGQVAATLGLHALAQCPSTWGFLCDVNLVEYYDDLHVRRLLGLL
jgi:hypothetical protein